MKQFGTSLAEVEKCEGGYYVIGCNFGDEQIRIGDFLNDMKDVGIEIYRQQFDECSPGWDARLKLSYEHRADHHFQRDNMCFELNQGRLDPKTGQMV